MNRKFKIILIAIVFTAVVTCAVIVKQEFLRTLPLIVSMFIILAQTEANRYAFIAGGINSLLYAWVYYITGLYGTALYALLVSFPIQTVTFFKWNKNSYKKTTVFRKFSTKSRILISGLFVIVWCITLFMLKSSGSQYALLDNTGTLLSVTTTILTFFAFVEYTYTGLFGYIITVFLNIQVMKNDPTYLPYFVFSFYGLFCSCLGFINVRKIYKSQQAEKTISSTSTEKIEN